MYKKYTPKYMNVKIDGIVQRVVTKIEDDNMVYRNKKSVTIVEEFVEGEADGLLIQHPKRQIFIYCSIEKAKEYPKRNQWIAKDKRFETKIDVPLKQWATLKQLKPGSYEFLDNNKWKYQIMKDQDSGQMDFNYNADWRRYIDEKR